MNRILVVSAMLVATLLVLSGTPTVRPAAAQKTDPSELDMGSVRNPECFPTGMIEVDTSMPNPTFVVTSTMAIAVHYERETLTGPWATWAPVSADWAVDGLYQARYNPDVVKVYPFPEGKGCIWSDVVPVARMIDFGLGEHSSELLPYGGLISPVEATSLMPVSPSRLSSYNCEAAVVAKVPNGAMVRKAEPGTLWRACVYTDWHTPLCEFGSHKGRLTTISGVRQDMPNWPIVETLRNCDDFAVLEEMFKVTPLARQYAVVNPTIQLPFLGNN